MSDQERGEDQPGFVRFECPECGFDSVLSEARAGNCRDKCPMCAGDSGHSVIMITRTARTTDRPEGRDDRRT